MLKGRRCAKRMSVSFPCHVFSPSRNLTSICRVGDLSSRGIWLNTRRAFDVGESLQLAFRPPRWRDANAIVCLAAVRRVVPTHTDVCGVGLEFYGIAPSQQRALVGYLYGDLRADLRDVG